MLKIHQHYVCCSFGRVLNDINEEREKEEMFLNGWIYCARHSQTACDVFAADPSDNKFNYFFVLLSRTVCRCPLFPSISTHNTTVTRTLFSSKLIALDF